MLSAFTGPIHGAALERQAVGARAALDRESRQRLGWHARDLAAQLAAEAREDKCERDSGSFLTHKTTENLLHQLKLLRPQQRMQRCEPLWDGHEYTDDFELYPHRRSCARSPGSGHE